MPYKSKIPFLESAIVLAPIAGPGTPELTAAAANAGAFAFLPCAYSDGARMRRDIEKVRELTSRPFGVNLFVEGALPDVDPQALEAANRRLNRYRHELGIAEVQQPARPPENYEQQIEVLLEARPRAFSFVFGIPSAGVLATCRDAGIYTIGTATSVEEALALEAAGVDAICAQGAEAGGHRGWFLTEKALPLIGTLSLVPLIVDAVQIPVIASGGIGDGRGIAAVLTLGAEAAQLGTAFLLAREAATPAAYRRALAERSSSETVITKAFSGRPARAIANRMTVELADGKDIAPFPFQNAITREVRNAAAAQERAEFLSLWAGQAFPLIREEPAAATVSRLLEETGEALKRAVHRDRLFENIQDGVVPPR